MKNHHKTGPAKSLLPREKRLYLNDGTFEKYIDSAVFYILGPSRSTPAQIPTHNMILQDKSILEILKNSKMQLEQLVNTHNTYNGNLGKELAHTMARKFTEVIPRTAREKYERNGIRLITHIWSKLNLVICDSDGGKIVEKANALGNARDSGIYERKPFNRNAHTMQSSHTLCIGLNSIMLGNISKGISGRRQLSTGHPSLYLYQSYKGGKIRQELPSPVQPAKPSQTLK